MNWYLKVVRDNYANFNGRASRQEYWMFILFNFIFTSVAGFLDGALGLGFLATIYSIAVLVPTIAGGVRRIHDVGKSGWFLLIPIYNLILAVSDSEPNQNRFGPSPKAAPVSTTEEADTETEEADFENAIAQEDNSNIEGELQKLKEMLDSDLITQDDYDAKKKELLGL